MNLCRLPQVNRGQIIFVDIADDPHVRKIGDGECRRRARKPHAGGRVVGHVLRNDDARSRGMDLYRSRGVIFVDPEFSAISNWLLAIAPLS